MPATDLFAPLRDRAATHPEGIALLASGMRAATAADLVRILDAAVEDLVTCGVLPSARVATVLPNAPTTATALLALIQTASAMPLNPALAARELRAILSEGAATHLATDPLRFLEAAEIGASLGLAVLSVDSRDRAMTGSVGFSIHSPGRNHMTAGGPVGADRPALILHTSGSTGRPKRVPLSAANLSASAHNLAASLELSPEDRCLSMMPMFHIGALTDLLLGPLYAGGSVAFAPSISAAGFFRGLEEFAPTWFQAVPTVLGDILKHAASREDLAAARRLRFIRAVSQPLPAGLQASLDEAFGVDIVPIFGMTETAGLVASMPLRGPRPSGSVGRPFGNRVMISDKFGNPVPAGTHGEVLVAGPTVMSGYEGSDERGEVFRGEWLRTGDEGYLDADGFLFLTGRLKDVINRGGEKISPLEIDLVMADHPAVLEAAAFAIPHPSLGEDVALAVVATEAGAASEHQLLAFLRERLAEHKVPRSITFLAALPRVPSGKLDRRALPEATRLGAPQAGSRTQPSTPLERSVAAMWSRVLMLDDLALEDDFFEKGGDSLSATTLAMMMEERFGEALPVNRLFEAPTLGGMAAVLSGHLARQDTASTLSREIHGALRNATAAWQGQRKEGSLILGRNTLGSRRPFFWVCQSRWQFELLSQTFDPDRPIYILSSLSNTGLKSDDNTRALASHYAEEIQSLAGDEPVLLGGFCQGGVVAFGIAKALRARGREVALLCLQDRFIPEPYEGRVALFTGKRGWHCLYDLADRPERGWAKYYSGPVAIHHAEADHDDLHKMPYVAEFARRLDQELRLAEADLPSRREIALPPTRRLDPRSYESVMRVRVPRFMRQDSVHTLHVKVTNVSPVTWERTERSGIMLAARWHAADPVHVYSLDARRPLLSDIPAGRSQKFLLDIRVPMRGTPLQLQIDLVDDGLHWFREKGPSGISRPVYPLPPRWP